MNKSVSRRGLLALAGMLGAGLSLGIGIKPQPAPSQGPANPELQVGIVQRFGRTPNDTITLQAQSGDRLTLRFLGGDGKPQTITTDQVKLEIAMQPLAKPKLQERVVLSTHRSFESAEDNANDWKAQGIPVEVAQPERWQVWAQRDVYKDPVARRLLLDSVKAQGTTTAFLDVQTLTEQPRATFVVNNYRYTRDQLEVFANQGVIQVNATIANETTRRLYAGSLRLQPNAYGNYTLVNQVPIETYLRGVVPHEIGTTAAPSVLEVQAILARTYALRNLRRFEVDNYQLCATTQCQVYFGLSGVATSTDRAIANTRGLVLTYQNELVDAVYSSSTGGVTAPFNDVWHGPNRPYLQAVIDSVRNVWDLPRNSLADEQAFRRFISKRTGFNEERQSNYFRWRQESTLTELNQELRRYLTTKKHPLTNFKTIQRLTVTQRSPAGRVLELTASTDQGPIQLLKDNILNAFDAPNSTLFYLEPMLKPDGKTVTGYAFVGGGLGHGVGLSQTGTYHLGNLGWNRDRILQFYYPGTQLQPLNSSITLWRDPQATAKN